MTRSDPDDAPPTWFRLSEASWAEIAAAYRQGATAKSLARQWKVSPTSVYRHACRDGWTKKIHGEAVARAHVAASRAADKAARAPPPGPPPDAEPAALRAAALARLARAIHEGRDSEALKLTSLTEKLQRLVGSDPDAPEEPFFVDWRPTREAVERETETMFREIALIALAMLTDPERVPAIFRRRVMSFRRRYLGDNRRKAMARAAEATERILKPLEKTIMDFNGPEPRPAVRRPARTWPPAQPPFPDDPDDDDADDAAHRRPPTSC